MELPWPDWSSVELSWIPWYFLVSSWSSMSAFSNKQLFGLNSSLVCQLIILPRPDKTFGHVLQNYHNFLASDWSSSFHVFSDKALFELSANFVGELIIGVPMPGWLLVMLCWIFGLLVSQFPHNYRQIAHQINWLWVMLCWIPALICNPLWLNHWQRTCICWCLVYLVIRNTVKPPI